MPSLNESVTIFSIVVHPGLENMELGFMKGSLSGAQQGQVVA